MSPERVLRGCLFGALGGFVAWVLIEFLPFPYPFRPHLYDNTDMVTLPGQQGLLGMVLGLVIGFFLGVSEGIGEGRASRFYRALGIFSVIGLLGGFMALYFGQQLFGALGGKTDIRQIGLAEFLPQLLIRATAWALIGLFLGVALGGPSLSVRRMWNGAVGGGLGGLLGGAIFQMMAYSGQFTGMQNRLVGFVILGGAVGFFINLFAEALKQVWIKVLVGRNEGREHVIDTPLAYVGRDELVEVPVFLDPSIPKRMCSLRRSNGRYALYPESDQPPILVNGEPLTPGRLLRDGDAIQFGRVTLGYYEKATALSGRRPVDSVPLASAPARASGKAVPTSGGACPYCGQVPDPSTGACACTVPDGGYVESGTGYGGYAAPQTGYADPGSYADYGSDPAYAATMMDAGGAAYPATGDEGPRLVAVAGPYAGQAFPLLEADLPIGRDPSQAIPLSNDSTASRRHARLYYGPAGWVIRDEGSSNGTWVNGVRVQEQPLYPGDTIKIGQTEFRFEG